MLHCQAHLHQHLVDDARAFVTSSSSATRRAQRVELVDEQHRGRKVAQHLKRLADAAGAHARVDVIEVGTCGIANMTGTTIALAWVGRTTTETEAAVGQVRLVPVLAELELCTSAAKIKH